jgi:nucleotide-binding universal stress UspA family protein
MDAHPTTTDDPPPPTDDAGYHRILVGFDGSPGARQALVRALRLAPCLGATVHVLSVMEHLPHYAATVGEVDEAREAAERETAIWQAEVRRAADLHGVAVETAVRAGHPARTLVDYAREGSFDLLVVGHSGRSGVWGMFLGTTTDKVTSHARCSVLVVR